MWWLLQEHMSAGARPSNSFGLSRYIWICICICFVSVLRICIWCLVCGGCCRSCIHMSAGGWPSNKNSPVLLSCPNIWSGQLASPWSIDVFQATITTSTNFSTFFYFSIIANLCLFVYFLIFEKGRLLCIHPVGWLVGRLVGWLTSPFFFLPYIEA